MNDNSEKLCSGIFYLWELTSVFDGINRMEKWREVRGELQQMLVTVYIVMLKITEMLHI